MKKNELCVAIVLFNIKRKGFSDLTKDFPHKSRRGNLYVMVIFDYDSNAILDKSIKKRHPVTIHNDFLNIYNILKSRCSDPNV